MKFSYLSELVLESARFTIDLIGTSLRAIVTRCADEIGRCAHVLTSGAVETSITVASREFESRRATILTLIIVKVSLHKFV